MKHFEIDPLCAVVCADGKTHGVILTVAEGQTSEQAARNLAALYNRTLATLTADHVGLNIDCGPHRVVRFTRAEVLE